MQKIVKKLISMVLVVTLLTNICGCAPITSQNNQENSAEVVTQKDSSFYYGTWNFVGVTDGNQIAYLDDLVAAGSVPDEAKNWNAIFQSTGKCYLEVLITEKGFVVEDVYGWEVTNKGVKCAGQELPLVGDYIGVPITLPGFPLEENMALLFQKISSAEEFPETQANVAEQYDFEISLNSEGIRPEIEDVVNRAEVMFDLYLDFRKTHQEKSDDLESILKYTEIFSKLFEVNKMYGGLNEDNLTPKENAYILSRLIAILGKAF